MSHEATDYLIENLSELRRLTYQGTDDAKPMRAIQGEEGLAVLLVLCDHANDAGLSWPGQRRMETETGAARRNVRRCLDSLQRGGLIEYAGKTNHKGSEVDTWLVFPGVNLSRGGRDTAPSQLSTGGRDTAPTVGAGVGAEVGAITRPQNDPRPGERNPDAARISGEKMQENRGKNLCITITPQPQPGEHFESATVTAARGVKKDHRWEALVEAAALRDTELNGPLTRPAKQAKRRREIEQTALEVLADFPTVRTAHLADLVVSRVHEVEPDPDLIEYLRYQTAAGHDSPAAGDDLREIEYTDQDTEPDPWPDDYLTKADPVVREVFDAANAMRSKTPGNMIGNLVAQQAARVAYSPGHD